MGKREGEREMSLIFNMFKYANPLKRAGTNWANEKGKDKKKYRKKGSQEE